jgi:hypothetical protein
MVAVLRRRSATDGSFGCNWFFYKPLNTKVGNDREKSAAVNPRYNLAVCQ